MHGAIGVIGPGAVVLLVLLFGVWGLSLYVVIDSLRRGPIDYTGVREGRWFYAVPQGLYFLVFALDQVPAISKAVPALGIVYVVALIPVIAHQVAYLLRVVFPTRARIEARLEAKDRALAEEYGVEYDGVGLDGQPDAVFAESAGSPEGGPATREVEDDQAD